MEGLIRIAAAVLILAYTGCAVWAICRRRTIVGSIGASTVFLCGGIVIIPVAEAVAAFVCWTVVLVIGLAVLGAVFGG